MMLIVPENEYEAEILQDKKDQKEFVAIDEANEFSHDL